MNAEVIQGGILVYRVGLLRMWEEKDIIKKAESRKEREEA